MRSVGFAGALSRLHVAPSAFGEPRGLRRPSLLAVRAVGERVRGRRVVSERARAPGEIKRRLLDEKLDAVSSHAMGDVAAAPDTVVRASTVRWASWAPLGGDRLVRGAGHRVSYFHPAAV